MFSNQGVKGKEKSNRQNNPLPKAAMRAAGKMDPMKTPCTLRSKHRISAHLTEASRESHFSTSEDKICDYGTFNRPLFALCSKQVSFRKFPEANTYRSFTEEQGTNTMKGGVRTMDPDQTTTENATISFTKRTTKTIHTPQIMQPAHAVKRYALLRGMLRQSRFEKDHDEKKDGSKGKMSQKKAQRRPRRSTCDTVHLDQEKNEPWTERVSFSDSKTVYGLSKTANVGSRNDDSFDIIGMQFPKRIYIREVSKGAVVDEIVDVQNEGDWEVLNYMSPLRHISCGPQERSESLKFRDLKNFEVYYYPHPWR